MKSKQDIQKVAIALAMAAVDPEKILDEDKKSKAKSIMDALLWVIDGPTTFGEFANPMVKNCPIKDEELGPLFDEAILNYNAYLAAKGEGFSE